MLQQQTFATMASEQNKQVAKNVIIGYLKVRLKMMCGVTGHLQTFTVIPTVCCLASICFAILTIPVLVTSVEAHAQGETATIQISGPAQSPGFFPDLLTVHVYDYVIFVNQSSPPTPYSISIDDSTFSSHAIAPGKQWSVTFTNPGAYEYHDAASPPHMVGEIVVVASNVALLPTPAPEIDATAIALIQAGKTPPDNLSLLTPTPTPIPSRPSGPSPAINTWPVTILLIVESTLLLLVLVVGSVFFIRFLHRRAQERNAKNPPDVGEPGSQKRRFPWLKRRKNEEDEDDEDEND